MKLKRYLELDPDFQSLPSRERGLKFLHQLEEKLSAKVAPLAGAWIEILLCTKSMGSHWSLPSRERGLKSAIGMKYIKLGLCRSPRGSMSEKGS